MKWQNNLRNSLFGWLFLLLLPFSLWGAGGSISISSGTVIETEGDTVMEFTITYSGTTAPSNIDFNYTTSPDTAVAWNGTTGDYVHQNAVSTYIPLGQKTKIIQIPIKGDFVVEGTEQFSVTIASSTTPSPAVGVGTITDNDSGRELSLTGAPVVTEGAGTVYATLTVNTTKTASVAIPFSYSTVVGSADSSDFTAAVDVNGSIPAGSLSTTFTIPILNDSIKEPQETFTVNLSSTQVTVTDATETVTINDDDAYTITATPASFSTYEGNSSITAQSISFTISQIPLSGDTVTASYSISHGGTNNSDFNATTGSVSFTSADSVTTKTISYGILGDTTAEPDETYTVNLSATNATISPASISGTILNDDSRLMSIGTPTAIYEGNSGTTTLAFPVSIISATTAPVTVTFFTTDGSATTADNDYVGVSSTVTVTIPAGSTTAYANVTVNGDTKYEGNEDLNVTLNTPSANATLDTAHKTATGTINNDDNTKPKISIASPVAIAEGDVGSKILSFHVTQNVLSGLNTTFTFYTTNGTATRPSDYTRVNNGITVTIPAGSLDADANVTINCDTMYEANETFTVTLDNNVNADLNNSAKVATGTINNDDAMPTISIDSNSTSEGNTLTKTLPFRVYLSAVSGVSTTVKYSTADGTGVDKATQPSDYVRVPLQTVTIPAGSLSVDANVTINGDFTQESDELFSVTLSGEVNATLNASKTTATGTITNDDNLTLRIYPASGGADVNTTEGNVGPTNADFNVTLSGVPLSNVSVTYTVGAPNAANATDFGGTFPTNTVSFAAGTTTLTQTIHIPIQGDYTVEPNENYTVTLSAPSNATIATGQGSATGNILNDDTNITIVSTASIQEGPCNTVYVDLNVTVGETVNYPITVNYTTSPGVTNPATAGSDYGSTGGSIIINANQKSNIIQIPIYNDTAVDGGETFTVTITSPAGITIVNDTATVTILDNQDRNVTAFDGNSTLEGDASGVTGNLRYTLTLCNPLANPLTISYTKSGTATQLPAWDADYNSSATSFIFPANQLSYSFDIPVYGDLRPEGNETVILTLNTTTGINLTDNVATGTIIDDDDRNISINDVNVTEGNPVSTTTATLRITMSKAATAPVTVNYSTKNGSATTGNSDYTAKSDHITFLVGDPIFQDVTFDVIPDFNVENNETFDVNISTPNGVTISKNTGTIGIIDDDNRTLTLGGTTTYLEGNVDRVIDLNVTVAASNTARSVTYTTTSVSAIAGSDYNVTSPATVTIPIGATSVNLPITIKGDLVYEPLSETFTVAISSPDGFAISNSPLTITVQDDDGNFSINSPSAITEGDIGDKNITFTVSLSRDMNTTVYIDYATSDDGATSPADYTGINGTLVFGPHEMSKDLNVTVHGDTEYEAAAQRFKVTLTNNVSSPNMVLVDNGYGVGVGIGTITDDDGRNVTVSSPTFFETESNTTRNFTIQLTAPMIDDLNLTYRTVNGSAIAGVDYVAIADTNITITGGTNPIINVPVTIIGNYLSEADKDFNLSVTSTRPGITISGGKMTIQNDDANLSLNPVSLWQAETNTSQTTTFAFTVNLSHTMDSNVTVHYWTTDGNATSVVGIGQDFNATNGYLTFTPGQTSKPINVTVIGDIMIEGDEYFDLNISNAQGVRITNSQSKGYILDDDGRHITINNVDVNETDSGSHVINLTVLLDHPSGNAVTIHYDINSSQATAGVDYNQTSGNVSIAAGDNNVTIPVMYYGDVTFENDEIINVGITTTTPGFQIDTPLGIVRLLNDDGKISIADLQVLEGDTVIPVADVNVTWSNSYEVDVNVSWTMHDGTATVANNDYTSDSGSFIIPANTLPATHPIHIPVAITPDYYSEPNETFHVILTSTQAVTFADNNSTVTILNDDNDTAGVFDTYYRNFDVRYHKNLYGDFASTGAPVMVVVDSSNNPQWNYSGNLLDANTSFIDQVPAMDGNNSSSADLTLPAAFVAADKILWAGLYWQGHIHGTNPGDITNAIKDYNTVMFRTPDGNDYNLTADITAGSNEIGYYNFRTSNSSTNPGYRMFYQGFKDVTHEVNDSIHANFLGRTFSVSGIKSTAGQDTYVGDPEAGWGGLAYGNFAGWSLVVVYEKFDKSNPDDLRNVTISDGYKFLIAPPAGSKSMDINISGFKTPKSGSVDSKMLFFGGLGEKNIHGDKMKIADRNGTFSDVINTKNPTANSFNDSITLLDNDINATRIYNPGIDLDIIDVSTGMSNDQNSTTIRLSVEWIDGPSDPYYNGTSNVTDQIFAGLVGFSTQLYQPQLCYDYTYRQNGIYLRPSDFNATNLLQKPLITNVEGSGTIEAGIYLKNVESDFPIEGLSMFTDMNGTRIEYIAGSSETAAVNGALYYGVSESASCADYETGTASTIACRFDTDDDASKKNVRIGLGRATSGYTKNTAGYLSSGDFVYSRFYLNPFADLNASGEDIGLKLNYFINLGDGEIPYEYTLGKNVKLCPPSTSYSPTLGQFNVIDSSNKNVSGTAGVNNLYTQVAKKSFDTDVAFYESNGGLFNIPPSSDVNTTVLVEIIDADAYHEINASCANPSAAITGYPLYVSLQANTPDNTTQIATQGGDYYNFAIKNAAFRVWWFDDGNGVLVQNWHAYKAGGSESNVTGNNSDMINKVDHISGLYNPSIHGDCNTTCNGVNNTTLGCLTCMKQHYMHPTCSRDNFSIRPESYDLRIYDQNQTTAVKLQSLSVLSGHIPTSATSNELNLSAGYLYEFDINATNHTNDLHSTPGYTRYFGEANSDYNATMKWDSTKTSTECNDVNDTMLSFNVINGILSDSNQSKNQTGEYLLNIIDKGWTAVDWRDTSHHTVSGGFDMTYDCTDTTSSTTTSGNGIGCIITSNHTNGATGDVYKNHDLRFKPYKFDLSTMVYGLGKINTISSGGSGFVYDANLSQDSDMNMSLRSTTQIKAVGYSGSTLSNFVGGCYAQDLNITIGHNANLGLAVPYTSRIKVFDINGTEVFDSNKTTINASSILGVDDTNFSKHGAGVVSTTIRLNFDRNITTIIGPQVVSYTDFNVSCSIASECNISADGVYNSKAIKGESAMDFNVTHVYGRVMAKDVRVFGDVPYEAYQWYEVYNAPTLIGIQLTPSKNGAQWYINKLHNESNEGNATVTLIQHGTTTTLGAIPSVYNLGMETYSFPAVGAANIPYAAKAHIDTDAWLWSKEVLTTYSDPSIINLDCFTHPCFNITVVPAVGATGSAKTNGTKSNKSSSQGTGWHSTSDYAPAIQ